MQSAGGVSSVFVGQAPKVSVTNGREAPRNLRDMFLVPPGTRRRAPPRVFCFTTGREVQKKPPRGFVTNGREARTKNLRESFSVLPGARRRENCVSFCLLPGTRRRETSASCFTTGREAPRNLREFFLATGCEAPRNPREVVLPGARRREITMSYFYYRARVPGTPPRVILLPGAWR